MMGNMKLSYRIWAGFGIILMLMLIMGIASVLTMKWVESSFTSLVNEYMPSVSITNDVERSSLETMYAMRGYVFSRDETYLKEGLEKLDNVQKSIKDAISLGEKYSNLKQLKENAEKAGTLATEYRQLANETVKAISAMKDSNSEMDRMFNTFVSEISSYLEGQNKKAKAEVYDRSITKEAIVERINKVKEMNDIIDLGNSIHIANLVSQSESDFKYLKEVLPNFDKIKRMLGELKAITHAAQDLERISKLDKATIGYREAAERLIATAENLQALNKKRGQTANEVVKAAEFVSKSGISETQAISSKSRTSLNFVLLVTIAGILVSVILGGIIAVLISRSIANPILGVSQMLQNASHEMGLATEQLNLASQKLSEAANESAASLEQTSSSMEEFSSMVKRNAANAHEVNKLAQSSKKAAETGDEEIRSLIVAMNGIVAGSKKIEEIISVIDNIAFQTNLLALNAAVEAARAGDHGKGFAVVADAVRDLAQRSSSAAKEITTIIKESVTQSDNGAKIAAKSGESLKEIVIGAKKVADLIGEITSASEEQSQGIVQITQAIGQIDQATQSNASSASEAASTSEELSSQVRRLRQSVGHLLSLVNGRNSGNAVSNNDQGESSYNGHRHYNGPERVHSTKPQGKPEAEHVHPVDVSKVIPFAADESDKDNSSLKLDNASGF
ncbi:MAG: MCP four helix bundle domain-containing protein [Oligoflexales bacterium]|nr:MCP four helix bundle domain-containing protein [Oligoflexales bacterium]